MVVQLVGVVEYTDRFSAEGYDSPNECPGYNIKQSDEEVQVKLDLWGMQSIPSLLSLPGLLWARMVAADKVLSIGQMERFVI